jgi:uncharacterized FAD-dependent dehydrogenase
MIKLSGIRVPITHSQDDILAQAAKLLRIPVTKISDMVILKQSLDARDKSQIRYQYVIAVSVPDEHRFLKKGAEPYIKKNYTFQVTGEEFLSERPVIIGAGPAGLFAAYLLAKAGFRPIVLERGASVPERVKKVESFYEGGKLDPETNVQFGEGGAGTFSDGKLNTLIKDRDGKGQFVLETFAAFGAPPEILYKNKPHIGTDILRDVIVSMRKETERLGAEFRFRTKADRFLHENGRLTGIVTAEGETIPCSVAVLAIGHSARDTIRTLFSDGIMLEPKAYALGVRIQHKREFIDRCQYGDAAKLLPAADYKLTYTAMDGRGVYSFCMCPGGYVVNASSQEGRLAVNGMSNHDRNADNSNAALVVTVTPEDFQRVTGSDSPLSGMVCQEKLEEAAFRYGDGKIPTQKLGDFAKNVASTGCGSVSPVTKGAVSYTNLREFLPEYLCSDLLEGIRAFDRMMPGFYNDDALLSAVESRTSSPVRILRSEDLESVSLSGLYPCGEGAGYAGGIMSAAMDGIRVFEAIIKKYHVAGDKS